MKEIKVVVFNQTNGSVRASVCYYGSCVSVESEVLSPEASKETRQYAVDNFMRNLSKVLENRIFRK